MKVKVKHLNHHSIYGDWDDVQGTQVLVFNHPNGIHCDVFVMNGCDYGGGISLYKESVLARVVDDAAEAAESNYDFHRKMGDLCQQSER